MFILRMEAEIFFGRRVTCRKKHSSGSLGKFRKKKKSQNQSPNLRTEMQKRETLSRGAPYAQGKMFMTQPERGAGEHLGVHSYP